MRSTFHLQKDINAYLLTNIYWLFLDENYESFTNYSVLQNLKVLYDNRFRKVDVLPMTQVAIGYLDERWRLFDVHKPYREASVMWQEIACCDEDLVDLKAMKCALWNIDKNQKIKRNLQGFAMPAATVV